MLPIEASGSFPKLQFSLIQPQIPIIISLSEILDDHFISQQKVYFYYLFSECSSCFSNMESGSWHNRYFKCPITFSVLALVLHGKTQPTLLYFWKSIQCLQEHGISLSLKGHSTESGFLFDSSNITCYVICLMLSTHSPYYC